MSEQYNTVCGVRTAVLQHISSDGRQGLDIEVSQVCVQIPHTVTIIYYQLSLDTTLGLQKTEVFDLFAVQLWTIKTIHLNRKCQLSTYSHLFKYLIN